jgi:hypothetical protein
MLLSASLSGEKGAGAAYPRISKPTRKNHCGPTAKIVSGFFGVDQYGRHLVIAGQRHDGVRAHRDIATAAQMGEKAGAATIPLAGRSTNDAHDLAIELEFLFRLGQQTGPLADLGWDSDLTFGRDAHGALPLTPTCRSKDPRIELQDTTAWEPRLRATRLRPRRRQETGGSRSRPLWSAMACCSAEWRPRRGEKMLQVASRSYWPQSAGIAELRGQSL